VARRLSLPQGLGLRPAMLLVKTLPDRPFSKTHPGKLLAWVNHNRRQPSAPRPRPIRKCSVPAPSHAPYPLYGLYPFCTLSNSARAAERKMSANLQFGRILFGAVAVALPVVRRSADWQRCFGWQGARYERLPQAGQLLGRPPALRIGASQRRLGHGR